MAVLTLDELVDLVQMDITVNCTLPKALPDEAIARIATQKGLRYFYRWYKYANQRTYYYVDLMSMYKKVLTASKFFYLPDEIESIKWIYMVNYKEFGGLGNMLPVGSIGMAPTSQPFVASINVSEWAEASATMNAFSDSLAAYSKNTVKFHFDTNSKRFEVLTQLDRNLILEVYANIPQENIFADPLFIKYVTGLSYIDYARVLGFNNMPQAGNVTINYDKYYELGTKMVEDVEASIKAISRATFLINRTR